MGKKVLTPEMEKYFVENALKKSEKEMAKKFKVSTSVVKAVYKKHSIKVPVEVWRVFQNQNRIGRTSFTRQQSKFIQDNYLKIPIKTIAAIIGKSGCGVISRMRQLGLIVPKEIADKRKSDGMFRTGHIPSNKGKKQIDYMSSEAIEKTKATRFVKDHVPYNVLKDWEESIREDKRNGRKYIVIKLPGTKRVTYKHIYVWETHNKIKVQPGFNIVFKDGNTLNIAPENLECISDVELMTRNTCHRYPKDITDLIHMKAAITRQINKKRPQENER